MKAFQIGLLGCASACALALAFSTPAYAQDAATADSPDQIADIVVTAQKREQSLQKVPLAVTAFSEDMIEARGITGIGGLAAVTPGLQFGRGGGIVTPFLRGVGSSAFLLGSESSVAVYTDGVYFTRLPVGFFSLNNVERVEVLKGPQGTLFGRNSSGGIIQIITKDPSHDPAMKASIGYDNLKTIDASAYVTGGLSEKIAADIAVGYRKQNEGYGRNIITGNRAGYEDSASIRSKLLFEPSDETRLTLSGFYAYSKVGLQGNTYPGTTQGYVSAPPVQLQTLPNFYDQRSERDTFSRSNGWGVSLKAEQDLDFARLTSITAFSKQREYQAFDGDYVDRPDFVVDLGGYIKQFTQELQLGAPQGSAFEWIVGLFYYNALTVYDLGEFRSPTNQVQLQFGPGLNSFARQRGKSYAAYAQATYEILPRLSLTGGLRYTFDDTRADGRIDLNLDPPLTVVPSNPARDKTKKLTFKAAVDYQLTDNILAYASFSRGFKSTGFNLLTYNPVPNKPEVLDAYEIGVKSDLFDRRLRLNAAIFQYDIKSPQVQLITAGTVVLSNAGSSKVQGAELEMQAALFEGLTARLNATYLDSKYKVYGTLDANGNVVNGAPSGPQNPNPPFGAVAPLLSILAGGNRTPQAAKLTLNAGLDYELRTESGDFFFTVDYYYNDGFFWEPDNFLEEKSYGLLSGRIKYMPTENLGISVWGKNLTKEKYATLATTQAGSAGYPFIAGAPRTYGVTLDFQF